jgi:hypothetical protein
MPTPDLRLVEVEWRDSQGEPSWAEREDAIRKANVTGCRSVGWVLVDDDDKLVIAACLDVPSDRVGDVTAIPRENIEDVHDLSRPAARRKKPKGR